MSMGTNYYLRPEGACATRCDNWIHLGKSSAGWVFHFAANDDATDWRTWLDQLGHGEIYDEYGHSVTRDQLITLITNKRNDRSALYDDWYKDADGNLFIRGYFS